EKQGNPGDLEQYYRLQEKALRSSSRRDSPEPGQPARHTKQTRHILWQSMAATVTGFLGRRSKIFIMCLGFCLVLLLGLVDYLTGPDLMFLVFYLAPIF